VINLKVKARAIEYYHTGCDGVEVDDWVEGYGYFSREHMCYMIITTFQKECGGVGSGIVEVSVKIDVDTLKFIEKD